MKIKMIKTQPGSTNGRNYLVFKEGEIYEIGNGINQDLANVFLNIIKCAVVPETKENIAENKMMIPPENKMVKKVKPKKVKKYRRKK